MKSDRRRRGHNAVAALALFALITQSTPVHAEDRVRAQPQMVQLTIKSVKCITPSSGMDGYTSIAIAAAVAAAAGAYALTFAPVAAAAAAPLTLKMVLGTGAGLAATGYKGGKAIEGIFDKVWPGKDELFIRVAHDRLRFGYEDIWYPDGQEIVSQQVLLVGNTYNFDMNTGLTIQLWEYDEVSGSDNMGETTIKDVISLLPYEEEVVVASDAEKSLYLLTIAINALDAAGQPVRHERIERREHQDAQVPIAPNAVQSWNPQYVLRCVFANGADVSYVTANNEIVCMSANGQPVIVGARVSASRAGCEWMYQTPASTLCVGGDGKIWGPEGQVGYVTNQ